MQGGSFMQGSGFLNFNVANHKVLGEDRRELVPLAHEITCMDIGVKLDGVGQPMDNCMPLSGVPPLKQQAMVHKVGIEGGPVGGCNMKQWKKKAHKPLGCSVNTLQATTFED
jgi:hypothetical protein